MSAAQWITGQFDPDPCPDQLKPEAEAGYGCRELSLPVPLPELQVAALLRIADWINRKCSGAGSGVIAIFTGRDAAGKLMAAEALAYEIQRTIYPVRMSEIGFAGEPHFARILDAASTEEAILMIDNANGLPLRLIQRLESYPGLSILIADSLGEVPTRVCLSAHSIVDFPFPADSE